MWLIICTHCKDYKRAHGGVKRISLVCFCEGGSPPVTQPFSLSGGTDAVGLVWREIKIAFSTKWQMPHAAQRNDGEHQMLRYTAPNMYDGSLIIFIMLKVHRFVICTNLTETVSVLYCKISVCVQRISLILILLVVVVVFKVMLYYVW